MRRALAAVFRSTLRLPSPCDIGAVVVVACAYGALLSWTGTGPLSFQARLCAETHDHLAGCRISESVIGIGGTGAATHRVPA